MRNLPNVITFCGLVLSLIACFLGLKGLIFLALMINAIAMICDLADGWLARRLRVDNGVGKWFDSISDIFIYLVFPAIVWFVYGNYFLLPIIIIAVAGIYRLIRFSRNGFTENGSNLYYAGMPVFYLQIWLLLSILISIPQILFTVVDLILSVLMLIRVRFIKPRVSIFVVGLVIYFAVVITKFV